MLKGEPKLAPLSAFRVFHAESLSGNDFRRAAGKAKGLF